MKTQEFTVESAWDKYRRKVMPEDAPRIQVVCCRRAFYAGALSMLKDLLAATDGRPSEKEFSAMITSLKCEGESFCDEVRDGRA